MATKKKSAVSRVKSAVRSAVGRSTTTSAKKAGGAKRSASKRGTSSKRAATTPAAAGAAASGEIETAADVTPNKPHRGAFKVGDAARHNDQNVTVTAVDTEAGTADIQYDAPDANGEPVWKGGVPLTEIS